MPVRPLLRLTSLDLTCFRLFVLRSRFFVLVFFFGGGGGGGDGETHYISRCLCFTGKWSCTDCFLVPNEYFCHILHRLKSLPLFSVRDLRHRRQPTFIKDTKRLSYKIYDEQLFLEVMEEQRFVPLKFSALYRNDNEVADVAEMDVEDA